MLSFRQGENVINTYYHHKFYLFVQVFPIVIFACVIVALAAVLLWFVPEILAPVVFLGGVVLLHIFWIALFVILIDFSLDFWVLTDARVIAVEQKGLFSQSVGEFELSKIQDVMVEVNGMIATMLNYGTVRVSTAGEHQDFEIRYVYNPNAMRDAILQASIAGKQQPMQI